MHEVIFSNNVSDTLRSAIADISPNGIFVLYPAALQGVLLPHIAEALPDEAKRLPVIDDEEHKTPEQARLLWEQLMHHGATRKSLIINVGGGVTTDLGGYVAACYMRGIRYINIPTTLLAMVDASTGGKTAVNLNGVKNIVGAFHHPVLTIVSPRFLDTLPFNQILSGYAEMIKHGLLKDEHTLNQLLNLSLPEITTEQWIELIRESVAVKTAIVAQDPTEQGLRKILNLGHTLGHAVESVSHTAEVPDLTHGQAVAVGLVCALVLSYDKLGLSAEILHRVARFVKENYPPFPLDCSMYEDLLSHISHDKKNPAPDNISFTLLRGVGNAVPSVSIGREDIKNAIDITRDLLGI